MNAAIWEIINPSDKYTFETDDHRLAAVVVCLLGEGRYGAEEEGGARKVPLFLFGGHDAWFASQFQCDFAGAYAATEPTELISALNSVMIGGAVDRQAYYKGLELITDDANKTAWRDHWHDQRRSSMNDIGTRAYTMAKQMEAARNKKKASANEPE